MAARRILSFLFLAPPAWGQRVVSTVDIGGAAMRYADSLTANGGSLSPAVALEWARATVGGAATISRFATGWSSQGALNASIFSPAAGALVAELAATGGGSAHQDGARTGQSLGSVRGHFMSDRAGVFIGLGAGGTSDGGAWRNVTNGELGAWVKTRYATLLATTTPTAVDDTIRYTDSQLSAHWVTPAVELGGEVGFRAGATGTIVGGSGRRWGSLAATTWLSPRVGVVLSGGTYPIDLTQGFPGGRFLTISLRLRSTSARYGSSDYSNHSAADRPDGATAMTFKAESRAGGVVALEIVAPGARLVEISGDFTGWAPVRLTQTEGARWTLSVPIARGTHQINVRLNGERWRVPPGLTPISDEFGGSVGLLVIEE